MQRLYWSASCASLGFLLSCSHPHPHAPVRATLSAAPSSSASAARPALSPARASGPSAPAARPNRIAYGYLGRRGILGTLDSDGSHWTGSFHFADGGQEISIEGSATPPELDPDASTEPATLDGRKVHSYLDCSFDASGASGVIRDASCLEEDGTFEVDGRWSAAGASEAFYLRTRSADAIDDEEYYAALLATPTPAHDCPPFAEMLSFSQRQGRAAVLYRLRWPCDPKDDPAQIPLALSGSPPAAAPPRYQAYLADFTEDAPHRLLWSSEWTTLQDPDDPNSVSLGFAVLDFAPGLELYVARISDDFQSPVSSGGNSSNQITVWAVSVRGRYGAKLDLPATESGHAGWCFSSSTSSETWLVDLDGDKVSEIVVRITESARGDAVGKSGEVECVETPSKVKFVTYRLNSKTLTWATAPSPPGLNERRLERGKRLEL